MTQRREGYGGQASLFAVVLEDEVGALKREPAASLIQKDLVNPEPSDGTNPVQTLPGSVPPQQPDHCQGQRHSLRAVLNPFAFKINMRPSQVEHPLWFKPNYSYQRHADMKPVESGRMKQAAHGRPWGI